MLYPLVGWVPLQWFGNCLHLVAFGTVMTRQLLASDKLFCSFGSLDARNSCFGWQHQDVFVLLDDTVAVAKSRNAVAVYCEMLLLLWSKMHMAPRIGQEGLLSSRKECERSRLSWCTMYFYDNYTTMWKWNDRSMRQWLPWNEGEGCQNHEADGTVLADVVDVLVQYQIFRDAPISSQQASVTSHQSPVTSHSANSTWTWYKYLYKYPYRVIFHCIQYTCELPGQRTVREFKIEGIKETENTYRLP
jgi:hypothetical protein